MWGVGSGAVVLSLVLSKINYRSHGPVTLPNWGKITVIRFPIIGELHNANEWQEIKGSAMCVRMAQTTKRTLPEFGLSWRQRIEE
jgi:hypothetical protein